MSAATISVVANKPFSWQRGLQLRTREKIVIVVPSEILVEGEPLGSIIELSDDNSQIAFQQTEQSGRSFAAIMIELQAGASLRLNRSTEAVALGPVSKDVIFDVISHRGDPDAAQRDPGQGG